ncbi:tyrosine--tRNA ligase [Candidatus Woesearchaeota archaeon]|nr:tyrosine--tRNA ligase [Candidatus Woesearchaeota archaeon]
MDIQERLRLINEVGEEILTEEDLRQLLERKKRIVAYDGFEPSGNVHIAQGLLRAINISKMIKAGVQFKVLVADWFAWMNNKLGGELGRIHTAGEYIIEVWKACGVDTRKVELAWTSEMIRDPEYWKTVIQIARNSTVKRIVRCSQIMGRKEEEVLSAAQIFYPCMQCADVFALKADITQLGIDQRKVNVLAREIGPKLGFWKPVVVSHHMLMGLGKPASQQADAQERAIEMKMSKSRPESAIFMTDAPEEVEKKMMQAYCPEGQLQENPVMEYCRYILFERYKSLTVERPAKFGGDITLQSMQELGKVYQDKQLHPLDLKRAVAKSLNGLLDPVRKHFEKNKKAADLLRAVKGFEITR